MTLLNEASIDDKFNTQMGKIQQAIEKLDKLALEYGDGGVKPVPSQKSALTAAVADLTMIKAKMFNL